MKTPEQIQKELDESIPRDVISQRDGGSGRKLSYLEGWYVIDRLNKVFGQGNWDYGIKELTKTFEGLVNDKNYVAYTAQVQLRVSFAKGEGSAHFTDVGFGDGQDARNPGKAHELAVKEAVTDGLKRCAKSLGMSMGLALYDKTQEHVTEGVAENDGTTKNEPRNAKASGDRVKSNKEPTAEALPTGVKALDVAALRAAIRAAARVLDSKEQLTLADFKKQYLSVVGAQKVDELSPEVVVEVYNLLKTNHPELKLT